MARGTPRGRRPGRRRPGAARARWRRCAGTSCGSLSEASSTNHTPSGKVRRTSAAIRSASLVLPTPPTPVRVRTRLLARSLRVSCSSWRRPTKLVSSAGSAPRPAPAGFALAIRTPRSAVCPRQPPGRPVTGQSRTERVGCSRSSPAASAERNVRRMNTMPFGTRTSKYSCHASPSRRPARQPRGGADSSRGLPGHRGGRMSSVTLRRCQGVGHLELNRPDAAASSTSRWPASWASVQVRYVKRDLGGTSMTSSD